MKLLTLQKKHPHGRGENDYLQESWDMIQETPPRAWGKPHDQHKKQLLLGNTPTGVGKTERDPEGRAYVGKHPHGRGENGFLIVIAFLAQETPPRAWGKLQKERLLEYLKRNTPTGVGKTYYK